MDNLSVLNNQQLLILAHDQGYQLSATQLARWHRAGLLPRPKQQARGRGRGTTSLYPLVAGSQLLLLCAFRRQERRLGYLAWLLWWAGYLVDMSLIRKLLQERAVHLSARMNELVLLDQLAGQDDDLIEYLEYCAETSLDYHPLRRVRKRVGRQHFPTLLRLLIQIAAGSFTGYDGASDRQEIQHDLRILARGLFLNDTYLEDQATIDRYMENAGLPLLLWLNSWLPTLPWMDVVEQMTDFDLMLVRDDLRFSLKRFDPALFQTTASASDEPIWGAALSSIMGSLSVDDQVLLTLICVALRRAPSPLL
jgi:hypothetical protein